jgi:colanic acid/amylovoran biosynthesis protein
MLIEIKGVQFVNKGAELMLYAVLEQIEVIWPGADIALAPNASSAYVERARIGAYQKTNWWFNRFDFNGLQYFLPRLLRNYLKQKWGIVTEVDIDILLDASGFAYGDQWSPIKTAHLSRELKRFAKHKKSFVFLPQALGPFTRKADVAYLKAQLPKASLICARESDSFGYVTDIIGANERLRQFPDFTNLVTGIVPENFMNGAQKVLIIPNSNMVGERNSHQPKWRDNYLRVLLDAVVVIRELGLQPVLLNHEGKGDGDLCLQIKEQSPDGENIEYIQESHPLKVKGIIGQSHAIICSRFHGCVSALSQGTPCLGTSWSHKYERLFDEYHRSTQLIAPEITKEQLGSNLRKAIDKKDENDYQRAIIEYKDKAGVMWQAVQERT